VTNAFTAKVLSVVRRIPPGRVATYGEVAALAGHPGAARAVGTIMRTSRRPDVPYHRVIAAGGRLGGFGGNEALKRALLVAEGIAVVGSRIRNLAAVSLMTSRPLAREGHGGAAIRASARSKRPGRSRRRRGTLRG
jgi:O-6-methylguanine DNA methyltransferase